MPGIPLRWRAVHASQLGGQPAHIPRLRQRLRSGSAVLPVVLRIAWLACASAAAVPEVAITSETRKAPNAAPLCAARAR